MANSFTRKTNWLWQNAENLLIILFLATFTLNIRKVFLTHYSFLNGTFNEYLTVSFSWADALMIAVLLIYTIKLISSQYKLSSSSVQETSQNRDIKENNKGYLSSIVSFQSISRETYLLLFLITWCFVSIAWSTYKPIAIYRCISLLEIFLFFSIAYRNLAISRPFFRIACVALILNGLIQALIAILQFICGHSLGLHFLGESIVSRETLGVAKIIINGMKHIRAYGTFPHPNVLAGFLIIPLLILLIILLARWRSGRALGTASLKEYNQSQIVSRATILTQVPTPILVYIFAIVGLAFVLTFSRSAFLGFSVIMILTVFNLIQNSKYKKQYLISLIFIIIFLFGFIYTMSRNTSLVSDQSIKERVAYTNVSREIISDHLIVGVGMGQFVLTEYNLNSTLEGWQYQPVHNIILLFLSELGIVGLVFFLLWISSLIGWVICNNRNMFVLLTTFSFCCVIYAFLPVFLFDHYFWDIKTGIIIFSLAVVFAFLRNQNSAENQFLE